MRRVAKLKAWTSFTSELFAQILIIFTSEYFSTKKSYKIGKSNEWSSEWYHKYKSYNNNSGAFNFLASSPLQ